MQPPAEHVHWLFATGVLFLGLLLLAEAIVGREVWCRRKWRAYLWPALLLRSGRPDVAGDGVLHELDHAHARPLARGRR